MPGNTWYKLGDVANDLTGDLYYRGQRIREAYYRGEQIWGEEFLGILLARLPNKLHYMENELLDYTGAKILGIWTHGHAEDITEKCEFYPTDGTLIDMSTTLLGIIVARLPNKTTYGAGEHFDYSGVMIVAIYADGHTVDITAECEFNPASGKSVRNARMVAILVTKLPDKTIYAPGEEIDYTGVKIIAVYSNGRLAEITEESTFFIEENV